MCNVGRDEAARGDIDDANELFRVLVSQLPVHFNLAIHDARSQWPRSLMRGSEASRLLRLWVRSPPGTWMSVSCGCCVLSGRGLCDGLITPPEESYRLWCV
jgi:hypothetical protein